MLYDLASMNCMTNEMAVAAEPAADTGDASVDVPAEEAPAVDIDLLIEEPAPAKPAEEPDTEETGGA